MPTLRYEGRRGSEAECTVNVAGVGQVKVGGTFEVGDDRASDLLAKRRNLFSLVTEKKARSQQIQPR